MPHAALPRSAAASAPVPTADHCWPMPLQETLKHSKAGLAQTCGISGSWCAQGFIWALQASLVGMGFDYKCNFAPPTILLGLLLCTWTQSIFFGGIQHSPVNGCSVASCNFGVLTGEDEQHTSFYSATLNHLFEWASWGKWKRKVKKLA